MSSDHDRKSLRVIKTARDKQSINEAAKGGFFPLVKKVERSDEIKSKFAVIQNKITGEIDVLGDFRTGCGVPGIYELVIDFSYFYPHQFPSPFAAYLVPPDLKVGERVILEDLIEDVVGSSWNQGDVYRLNSCQAVWNGSDFELDHNERFSVQMIG